MSARRVSCHHCEGWGCTHCELERRAASGGEQGLTAAELEFDQMRAERDAALKRVAELEAPFEMTEDMFRCIDCKAMGDDYWLDDAVWSACVPEDKARSQQGLHTFVCSPCFEKRLGRPWRASDFQAGNGPEGFDTNRLMRVAFARAETAERERDAWQVRCLKAEAALHEAREDRDEAQRAAAWAQKERDAALNLYASLSKGGAA